MVFEVPVTKDGTALHVVVIGGSLAGLMHGIILKHYGHHVQILERAISSNRENQAAGITAGPHVQAFLEEFDTSDTPWYSLAPGVKVLDSSAKVRIYRKMDLNNTSWDVLYYRMRAMFDGYKSVYCPQPPSQGAEQDVRVSFDNAKRVIDILDTDAKVTVKFEDVIDGVIDNVQADLVVVAGGASCDVRNVLLQDSELRRPYSGYLTWRGTVPECDVSEGVRQILCQENTLYTVNQGYVVIYAIPGKNGSLEFGKRTLNLVWYCNHGVQELQDILTDIEGHEHRYSLPPGMMRSEVWSKQKVYAETLLPHYVLELIRKIQQPFVTVISDTTASRASFFGGKVLLVGDALTLFRPHVALSSDQAAFDALQLKFVLQRDITLSEWEARVLQYARLNRLRAISWGAYFQMGWLAYFTSEIRFRGELGLQWLINRWYRGEV